MQAYHGSDQYNTFKRFKKSKTGALGPGIYFTTKYNIALEYALHYNAGNIYEVELDVKNPYYVQSISDPAKEILSPALYAKRITTNSNYCYWVKESDIKKLQRAGYDAIITRDEVMVFSHEQITMLNVTAVSRD